VRRSSEFKVQSLMKAVAGVNIPAKTPAFSSSVVQY
jgi:hypothetical protein